VSPALFADAMAPGLLVAQGIGRIGNYFNKELFGRPTTLPWGLEIPYQYRVSGGIPAQDLHFATFQPTFLYELIFDLAWAGVLIWLGPPPQDQAAGPVRPVRVRLLGVPDLRGVARVDSSVHILGLRLNMYIASILAVVGAVWFYRTQRRPDRVLVAQGPGPAPDPAPDPAEEATEEQARDPEEAAPGPSST
jgi:prolipoprotein diacylglyceryltransferase